MKKWRKYERFFAKSTVKDCFKVAPFLLFLNDSETPCRCGDSVPRLMEGIDNPELFKVGMLWFDGSIYKFSVI